MTARTILSNTIVLFPYHYAMSIWTIDYHPLFRILYTYTLNFFANILLPVFDTHCLFLSYNLCHILYSFFPFLWIYEPIWVPFFLYIETFPYILSICIILNVFTHGCVLSCNVFLHPGYTYKLGVIWHLPFYINLFFHCFSFIYRSVNLP